MGLDPALLRPLLVQLAIRSYRELGIELIPDLVDEGCQVLLAIIWARQHLQLVVRRVHILLADRFEQQALVEPLSLLRIRPLPSSVVT